MPLSVEDLERHKAKFSERTVSFARAGYDRFGAPEFILDLAPGLEGPALDVGTGSGITARALAGRGLEVVSIDMSADDQQIAAFLTEDQARLNRIQFRLADAANLLRWRRHSATARRPRDRIRAYVWRDTPMRSAAASW